RAGCVPRTIGAIGNAIQGALRTMVLTSKQSLDELYSQRGKNVSPPRVGDPSKSAEIISFIYGFPDPESLPAKTVAEAAVRALESNGQWALQYGATMGARP